MSNITKKRVTNKDQFVDRAKSIHGNRYDYTNSVYTKSKNKILIRCRVHGDFSISAGDHIQKKETGCRKCAMVKISRLKKLSQEQVINQFIEKHGNRYCYDNFKYLGNAEKSEIICKIHGSFLMTPTDHKSGNNCSKCSKVYVRSYDDVIAEANEIHNQKYSYISNNYKNTDSYLIVVCPYHGKFKQRAASHLRGKGCHECGKELLYGYRKGSYVDLAKKNHGGKSNFYIIKMSKDGEVFYKQGITMKSVNERFRKDKMPYNIREVAIYRGCASFIWDIELILKKINSSNKYNPLIEFGGKTECFSSISNCVYDEINKYIISGKLELVKSQ